MNKMKLLKFNEQGHYVDEEIVDAGYEPKENELLVGVWDDIAFEHIKLVNGQLVEGLTPDEIAERNKPVPSLPTVDEKIEQIESRLLSPSEIYERLDKTTTQLEQLKHYKLDQLNELCNKAIVRGFVYIIENKEYLFSASVEAQGNFQGTDSLFKEGLIQEVYWSVTNTTTGIVERVRLDNVLFNQVKIQLFNHINTHISKFRDYLQPLVLEASTNSEVDAINW